MTLETYTDDELYSDHWTPQYRAWVKRQADRQWDIISKRYDALRTPKTEQSK